MQPSRHHCLFASLAMASALFLAPRAHADTLKITSTPPGATVEIDGLVVGKTPCSVAYPGGFFHKTHSVFGEKLQHSMNVRISKDGFTTSEIALTEGPFEWVSLTGRDHGHYWLIKSKEISATLDPASAIFTGTVHAALKNTEARPELSTEEIVETAGQAVVKLSGLDGTGSGFFVTDTGVIATNHHVTTGNNSLDVILPSGKKLPGQVVYTDGRLDIALVKVSGSGFPYLPLADISQLQKGQTVIAIGNPGASMPNVASKGIISGIGENPFRDPGTWIQTDAAINPGNSGGPLLNLRGEVVGINTEKSIARPGEEAMAIQGLAFALSSGNLLEVLQRFYPDAAPAARPNGPSSETGAVAIASDPSGADIYIDGKFVGQTPSTIPLVAGTHTVEIKSGGKQNWARTLDIANNSQISLRATLDAVAP